MFISLDDKHRIKITEPGFPVAAVERGKRVIVSMLNDFVVGDYDLWPDLQKEPFLIANFN